MKLNGDIVLKNVTVEDQAGHTILEDINLTIPYGARVAVKTTGAMEGTALADLLTREIIPKRGQVTIAGHPLNSFHQTVISSCIGYAHSEPYIFEGTLGNNLLMPFKHHPNLNIDSQAAVSDWQNEASRSGNSTDPVTVDWVDPVSPLGSNLLFSLPVRPLQQETLAGERWFVQMLETEGLMQEIIDISSNVIDNLTVTFGQDGTDHPLFRMLNLDKELYLKLGKISANRRESGNDAISSEDLALLMTVPFAFSAEQIGPAFKDSFKERVMKIRRNSSKRLVDQMDGLYETLDPEKYTPIMTLLGNAIYGRISGMAGEREDEVVNIIVQVFNENGLRRQLAQSIYDLQTGLAGANLPAVFRERVAFSRAGIKRPDILILRNALASHDADARAETRKKLRTLLPDATKIFIEKHFNNPESYDLYLEIVDGRIDGAVRTESTDDENITNRDLNKKLKAMTKAELFANLDRKSWTFLA